LASQAAQLFAGGVILQHAQSVTLRWQQLLVRPPDGNAPCGMISDPREHVGEVLPPGDAVELGALDQRVYGVGGTLAAGIRAGEQAILAADRDAARGSLGRKVPHFRRGDTFRSSVPYCCRKDCSKEAITGPKR
jgi:hypothetical protein